MTDNEKMREDAIREAARNHAGDEYFNADRAYLLVSPYSGRIFDAGFDRGWQAAQAEQSVPAAIMDSQCTYYSFACSVCNKCGRIHDGGKSVPVVGDVQQLFQPGEHGQTWVPIDPAELERLRKDAFMWEARYKTLAGLFASVAPSVDEIDDSIRAAIAGEKK